jgi:hypothetical protein
MNGTGHGCRRKAHHSIEIYDALPRPIRDRLKIARTNLCPGCVRARLRKEGLQRLLHDLDFFRLVEPERHGREVWLVPREELRP